MNTKQYYTGYLNDDDRYEIMVNLPTYAYGHLHVPDYFLEIHYQIKYDASTVCRVLQRKKAPRRVPSVSKTR